MVIKGIYGKGLTVSGIAATAVASLRGASGGTDILGLYIYLKPGR